MKAKETIKEILEKWGFPVLQEIETSFAFRYQMSYIHANISMENEEGAGLTITLSGLFKPETEEEMRLGLMTCNDLNCNMMQVKLYIDGDSDLMIASEFFIQKDDEMEFQLTMGLKTLIGAKRRFLERYRQIKEETELLSELEEE